jgi:hypothetical protein
MRPQPLITVADVEASSRAQAEVVQDARSIPIRASPRSGSANRDGYAVVIAGQPGDPGRYRERATLNASNWTTLSARVAMPTAPAAANAPSSTSKRFALSRKISKRPPAARTRS